MYYTDDSILPENMTPLVITAAPFGPQWLPGDADIPVTWEEQVQTAVDCYNAGATQLHVHVRNPATGKGSVDFDQYNYFLGLLRNAVPKMILQVGGSISFSPKTDEAKAKWLSYDTRHMLTELDPKPDNVTVAVGSGLWDVIQMMTAEDIKGTHLEDPKVQAAWAGMEVSAGPAFYLEHLKRLRQHRIQPYFVPGHTSQLELIERLIRAGVYMGPMNVAVAAYGGGTIGRNPFDWMEMIRRIPHGASTITSWSSMRGSITMNAVFLALGHHCRVGNEDNLWGANRQRATSVKQIEGVVRVAKEFGREVATAEQARKIMKVGVWYDSVEETLQNLALPPNRKEGQTGFLLWDTDGKKTVAKQAGDSHPVAYCMVPPDVARTAAD